MNPIAEVLSNNKYDLISSGLVSFNGNNLGFKKALLVRDNVGHAVRVVEK
jgi:hypothetical protein